jgi:inner membrane transporter RhtA
VDFSDVRTRSPLLPVAALLAAMASVTFGASYAKQLFPQIGAEGVTALRLPLAALMLAVVLRPWRLRITRATWPAVLAYGGSLGGMNFLFYKSLETVPLGIAVALEFLGPLCLALSASRRLSDFGWIALAVAGLAFLLPIGAPAHAVDVRGALFALAAGVFWAAYIVFGRRAGVLFGTGATALGTAVAAILVLPVGVAHAGADLLTPHVLVTGAIVALFSSALSYTLEMVALTRLPTRVFGTMTSLEPAVAAMMGWAMLAERLTPVQWLAILAIIAASTGTTITVRATAETLPD